MRTVLLRRLKVDAVGTIVEREIVDIDRAEKDLQCVGDLESGMFRLFAVFRSILTTNCGSLAVKLLNSWKFRVGVPGLHQFACCVLKFLQGCGGLILHFDLETAKLPESLNCRRFEGHHDRAGDGEEWPAQTGDNGRRGIIGSFTDGKGFKFTKTMAKFEAAPEKLKPAMEKIS